MLGQMASSRISPIISATKGIEGGGFRLMSQVLEDYVPRPRIGALSGGQTVQLTSLSTKR